MVDDMTIDIDGIEVELRLVDKDLLATWQSEEGEREKKIEASWSPPGGQSDEAEASLEGLEGLDSLWGWKPLVLNEAVPDNWCQYIVDRLVAEALLVFNH